MSARFYEKIAAAEEAHRLRLAEFETTAKKLLHDCTNSVNPEAHGCFVRAMIESTRRDLANISTGILEAEREAASREFGIFPEVPLVH